MNEVEWNQNLIEWNGMEKETMNAISECLMKKEHEIARKPRKDKRMNELCEFWWAIKERLNWMKTKQNVVWMAGWLQFMKSINQSAIKLIRIQDIESN